MSLIAKKLETIRHQIVEALKRSGRPSDSVRLVAASKTISSDQIRQAIEAGVLEFGENKVQEARSKIPKFEQHKLNWCLIGHLQKNKVKYIFDLFDRIDSVDSLDLAKAIHLAACRRKTVMPILVQVNLAHEVTKFGVTPNELEPTMRQLSLMDGIQVQGLMTITPFDPNPEKIRPYYAKLRELRDRLTALKIENIRIEELSMGMTNDFVVAIEEGATMVRLGKAIFGES